MLNIEKYADEIREIMQVGQVALTKDRKPVVCHLINCEECVLDEKFCGRQSVDWFLEEYQEKPEVTEEEYYFCKMLGSGYLYEREDGALCWQRSADSVTYVNIQRARADISVCKQGLAFKYLEKGEKNAVSIQELIEIYEASHDIKS